MRPTIVPYHAEGWGVGELWLDGDRLLLHDLPRPRAGPGGPGDAPSRGPRAELAGRLVRFFAGEEACFADVELDLEWCTPFQRAVADALRQVGRGETVTYGELAARAGRPNAHRAAGTFCAQNRFPILLPCHRVVAAADLGSYGSLGLDYKRRLLRLEDAPVAR